MPPLPIVKGDDPLRALVNAGFVVVRQRGSHVRLRHSDGRALTVPLHAGHDMGRGLLRKILRDADLSVEEFLELLEG